MSLAWTRLVLESAFDVSRLCVEVRGSKQFILLNMAVIVRFFLDGRQTGTPSWESLSRHRHQGLQIGRQTPGRHTEVEPLKTPHMDLTLPLAVSTDLTNSSALILESIQPQQRARSSRGSLRRGQRDQGAGRLAVLPPHETSEITEKEAISMLRRRPSDYW